MTSEIAGVLNIRSSALREEVQMLSGGNQQKVVFAKWLFSGTDVLILDEPTKGVDVAAKEEIHQIMKDFVERGKAILMISSDMMELLHISNRILVMNRGRIVADIPRREATKEKVLSHAIGQAGTARGV
jgi:ABC-type sugar transport system ATPase subunit